MNDIEQSNKNTYNIELIEEFKKSVFDNNRKNKYGFATDMSKNIDMKLVDSIDLDRNEFKKKLFELTKHYYFAINIEKSIFEFSLLYIIEKHLKYEKFVDIYNDKFIDLYNNINPNSHIGNKTLLDNIINFKVDTRTIAFMKPYEINPEKWKHVIEKNKFIKK